MAGCPSCLSQPNVADQQVDRRIAEGEPQGNPAESALMGGAVAPTGNADGIRHDERARTRPLIQ